MSCGLTLLCVSIWWPTLTSQRFSTFFCSYCLHFCQYCDAGLSQQHNHDIDLSSFLLFIFYCQQYTVKISFSFNLISCVALFVIDHGMWPGPLRSLENGWDSYVMAPLIGQYSVSVTLLTNQLFVWVYLNSGQVDLILTKECRHPIENEKTFPLMSNMTRYDEMKKNCGRSKMWSVMLSCTISGHPCKIYTSKKKKKKKKTLLTWNGALH